MPHLIIVPLPDRGDHGTQNKINKMFHNSHSFFSYHPLRWIANSVEKNQFMVSTDAWNTATRANTMRTV